MKEQIRCSWANPKNPLYIRYHDEEWGVPVHDDHKLFEMLMLESFQAGLSWECMLNKQEPFYQAFDRFNLEKSCGYGFQGFKAWGHEIPGDSAHLFLPAGGGGINFHRKLVFAGNQRDHHFDCIIWRRNHETGQHHHPPGNPGRLCRCRALDP